MNLPNKLTLLRILLVPVFLVCMYLNFPYHYVGALLVFAIASITDALDGSIARKHNLITTFGKFADPLADKILVLAAFASLADTNAQIKSYIGYDFLHVDGVIVTIIASREFMVSGLRLVTAEKGVVVSAGIWGKLKTAFTMVTEVLMLLWLCYFDATFLKTGSYVAFSTTISIVFLVLVWISVLLTIISGAVYLKGYWKYIDMK